MTPGRFNDPRAGGRTGQHWALVYTGDDGKQYILESTEYKGQGGPHRGYHIRRDRTVASFLQGHSQYFAYSPNAVQALKKDPTTWVHQWIANQYKLVVAC